MKISTRLTIGFGLLIMLFIICTLVALTAFTDARKGMDDALNVKMRKYQLVLNMRGGLRDMSVVVRNIILITDPHRMQQEWQRLTAMKAQYISNRESLAEMVQKEPDGAGRVTFAKVIENESKVLGVMEQAGQLGLQNRQKEATDFLLTTVRTVQFALLDAIDEMTNMLMQNSQEALENNSRSIGRSSIILIILAATSILLSVATGVLIVRLLMRQLGGEPAQAQALAAAIAEGDLNSPLTLRKNDRDSLLASLGVMQSRLRELVSQIKDTSSNVALAADEIAQGNTELSSRTEQQAAALQETAASMEQLTATVKSNTAGAHETARTARETAALAQAGEADVHRMSDTMHDISHSAKKSAILLV